MRKRTAAILLAFTALISIGCTSVNTKADQAAIAYTGGPMQGTHFNKVIQPGSGLVWLGLADDYYLYPTTQRSYIISTDAAEGDKASSDHIEASNKDGVQTYWQVAVYFKLNTEKIRKFHENVGLKYHANFTGEDTPQGWKDMLNDTFRQQIEGTIQVVAKRHTTDEFAQSDTVYAQLATEVASGLKDSINVKLGDNYFCGPTFSGKVAEDNNEAPCPDFEVVVKKVDLPQATKDAYSAQKNAQLDVVTKQREGDANVAAAQKQADANVAEAQGKQKSAEALADIYSDPAFIEYMKALAMQSCAANPSCVLVVSNDGSGVNVNVQGQK